MPAGVKAVLAQISTEWKPSVPHATTSGSSQSLGAGDAPGRAALSSCEDDVLREMEELKEYVRQKQKLDRLAKEYGLEDI